MPLSPGYCTFQLKSPLWGDTTGSRFSCCLSDNSVPHRWCEFYVRPHSFSYLRIYFVSHIYVCSMQYSFSRVGATAKLLINLRPTFANLFLCPSLYKPTLDEPGPRLHGFTDTFTEVRHCKATEDTPTDWSCALHSSSAGICIRYGRLPTKDVAKHFSVLITWLKRLNLISIWCAWLVRLRSPIISNGLLVSGHGQFKIETHYGIHRPSSTNVLCVVLQREMAL